MSEGADLPILSAIVASALLVGGAGLALIGSLGLIRLRTFYERVHAPTLGTTLGTVGIAAASMVYFSSLGSPLAIHEILIVAFVTGTTPISLMILIRAAVFRDSSEGERNSGERADDARR